MAPRKLLLCLILGAMPLLASLAAPLRRMAMGAPRRPAPRARRMVLRCKGGAGQSPEGRGISAAADIAVDGSYWLDIGPRILKTVKDMLRATEKLLDHSAASARALHRELEESGARLGQLKEKADAAGSEDGFRAHAGADANTADRHVQEQEATEEMADFTLELQQQLMVHMGTVTLLTRRAAYLQETVSLAQQLIYGGVLDEILEHVKRLVDRRGAEGSAVVQEAKFERNFDRMAVDWLLCIGEPAEAKQLAELAGVPVPALPKFEAARAALDRLLEGDLAPIMVWWHKQQRALAHPDNHNGAEDFIAHLHIHQLAELLGSRRQGSVMAAVELYRWWLVLISAKVSYSVSSLSLSRARARARARSLSLSACIRPIHTKFTTPSPHILAS